MDSKHMAKVEELEAGILAGLSEEGSDISAKVRDAMRTVLVKGRGNGRREERHLRLDAEFMAFMERVDYEAHINSLATGLGVSGRQEELLYDIALMTFNVGRANPDTNHGPAFYGGILKLLG